jgi:hypothetical protein
MALAASLLLGCLGNVTGRFEVGVASATGWGTQEEQMAPPLRAVVPVSTGAAVQLHLSPSHYCGLSCAEGRGDLC